jgi:tetratricopeptide (TPR) repeat protein
MWKTALVIIFFSAFCSACENPLLRQNRDVSVVEVSPTETPKRENPGKPLAEVHFYRGLKFKAAGEYERAIEEFKKSIEAGNDDKEMYRRLAELYLALKKYEEAENYLRIILEKDSKDLMAHWALAKILVENLGKYDEGLKEALLSKELYGKDGSSHVRDLLIGKAYDGLGDYENAIKHYKLFLKGTSYAPDSDDYKETKKRISEIENKKAILNN